MQIQGIFVTGILDNKDQRTVASGHAFDLVVDLAKLEDVAVEFRIVVGGFTKADTYTVVICDQSRRVIVESNSFEIEEGPEMNLLAATITLVIPKGVPKRGQIRCLRVASLVRRDETPSDDDELAIEDTSLLEDLQAALDADLEILSKDEDLFARVAHARRNDEDLWCQVGTILSRHKLLRSITRRIEAGSAAAAMAPAAPVLVPEPDLASEA